MSNSGNTLNKKTIIAIVIIAVLLIAAIIGVVVFLKDQGETSAMAENGSQTSSDENVQARQEEQNQEPQEQAQTEEQNTDTQNNEQDEPSTEVATTNDGATNDGANQGGATTGTTNNSGSSTGTTNSGNNANNNDNDAENIQESVIEETQIIPGEEIDIGERKELSWTPQALATVSAIAGNMQLNAPNLVTEKTSTVYNDDGTRAEDQTKIALDQKVTYTIIIENRGNVEGTIEKGKTYDTLPKGFDYSKTRAEDYEFKVEKISATGESTTGDEVLSYSDFKFGKENATLESQTLILDKDVKLGAGEKLFITYSLKVDPKYLEDENGLVANKHIDKNVVTVNNLPVEDKNEYDGVQPLVKVEKISRILRGEDLKETDIAKIADFIEYTIHIENNGEADTKVTVKDSDLEKILADGKAEFRSGDKTAEELINGFDVEVAHKDYVDIKFVIEIKDITGAIENGVEVKDTTPQNPDPVVPENPDKVNTVNITATKGIITDGAVYEKDTLTYTITLQNSGNTEGTVSVKDSIPEGLTFKEGSIKINGNETEYTQNDLEDGNIKVTVPGNNGKVVVSFMVTADILDGKESLNIDNTAYVDDEPTNTVTTTVNKAYISVEVNKEWKDNDIQANRRPDKVTFILVADGGDTDTTLTVDVSKTSDKQNYKFEKPIAKYNKDGKQIKYTVREEGMGDFYKSTVSKPSVDVNGNTAVTVTNEFKLPEGDKNKTDVTVTKIWEDNNNYAGKRTSVNIKITGSNSDKNTKTVTLKDNDAKDNKTWQITVNGMTKYDANGVEIKYTASEENVPEFYKLVKIEGTTVTNEFELPKDTVNYKVNKVWDDNEIQAQRRPEAINFVLTKTVKDKDGNNRQEVVDTKTLTTSKENYVEFKELPKYDDKANVIDYNVTEGDTISANGENFYKSTVSNEETDSKGNIEVTVTNKFKVNEEKTDLTLVKKWDDNDNKERPSRVTFAITATSTTGNTTETQEVKAKDGWTKTLKVNKYDEYNNPITYSVEEVNVENGYVSSTPSKENNTWTVTNTLPSMTVDKKVSEIIKANGDVVTPEDENSKMTVAKDDIIKYTITVTNNTNIPLSNVVVTDKDLQITSDKDGKNPIKDGIVIKLTEQLVKGQSATVDVYYKVTDSNFLNDKQITNTVNAEGKYTIDDKEYPVKDSDSETVSVEQVPGISITKTQKVTDNAPATPEGFVGEGDVITYTITVKNTGNTDLTNVTVKDVMTGKHGKLNIDENKLNIGNLEKEGTRVITATYTVTKEDISSDKHNKIVNTATVTADEVDADDSTVSVDTEIGKPNISLEKDSEIIKADKNKKTNPDGTPYTGNSNVAEPGDTIKYTITVKNDGNVTGTAKVEDSVPDGTNFIGFITDDIEMNNNKFSTTVELGPQSSKTIVFEVKVTAKPGQKIKNTATLDGKDVTEETTEDKVEKTVKVTTNTSTPTITNSNVVIVLDVSGSMKFGTEYTERCYGHGLWDSHENHGCKKINGQWYKATGPSRLSEAQETINDFIDSVNLPAEADSNSSTISLITFSDNARKRGSTATTASGANTLKNTVNGLTANGGTYIEKGLDIAYDEIESLEGIRPNNNNIVIFIGDGEPSSFWSNSKIESSGEKLHSITDAVYAIGFEEDVKVLEDYVASSPDKYYTTSDNLDLSDIFTQIGEDLSDPVDALETSENGKILLDNIDTAKDVTIKVGDSQVYKGKAIGTDYIVRENGQYYLDTSKFNADADIEIQYSIDS